MKFILFTAFILLAVVCLIEAEAESERRCIKLETECTSNRGNCCGGLKCECYKKMVKGSQSAVKCWCIEKDVIYIPQKSKA